jgi:hypothetical protein
MPEAALAAIALVLGLNALHLGLSPAAPAPLVVANALALVALVAVVARLAACYN